MNWCEDRGYSYCWMSYPGGIPITLIVGRGPIDETAEIISAWLGRHGIQVSAARVRGGMSIRRWESARRIGILCECVGYPCGEPVVWHQLEAEPLPWPVLPELDKDEETGS